MENTQKLLTAWQDRHSHERNSSKLSALTHEIEILETLQTHGCLQTHDGLFVKNQLEKRRQQMLEMVQDGKLLNIPPKAEQNIPPSDGI